MSIDLIWIVVKDFDKALKEYTEVLGFKIRERADEWKWAELQSPDGGCTLGICEENEEMIAGTNAVITITVKDLDSKIKELQSKGATLEGDVCEVPGHVKMQTLSDKSGNRLQIVQKLTMDIY